jgi:tetratricopeptide (TPR) repeat protein
MSAHRAWPLLVSLLLAVAARAEVYVWIDAEGGTHMTDDPEQVPASQPARSEVGRQALTGLWDEVLGPVGRSHSARESSSRGEDRSLRLVRGAVSDLARGETARASAALESVLRIEPGHSQAHWYLALLDRQRGRYDGSEAHLRAFLASAGDDLEPWRASAERRLAALEDERHLADEAAARQPSQWVGVSRDHFRIRYDSELVEASPDYAETVMRYLGEARQTVADRLGAVPSGPMGVILYGKAAYLEAHRHRFSFQTVGFFDGRIHVVSAAHPAGELRALLFHEYTHAVYREQTGGDRPYWLNEGLAEVAERASRNRVGLTRSERMSLRRRIDDGRWLSLRRLAPSFAGLDDRDARAAYIQALAAAAWIEVRTTPESRARLLAHLSDGASDDEALREAVGLDTAGIDSAVREEIRSEFAPSPDGIRVAPADVPAL